MKTSEIDFDSPAIKALGSLFKLTEVFLWDDGCASDNRQISSCPKHIRFKYDDDEDEDDCDNGNGNVNNKDESGVTVTVSLDTPAENSEESVPMEEDGDLFQEMSALGLPLSFQTSKKSSAQVKGKHKAIQCKGDGTQYRLMNPMHVSEEISKQRLKEKSSNASPLSLLEQTECSCSGSDVSNGNVRLSNSCEGEKPESVCGRLEDQLGEQVPKIISSESLIDDLLVTDYQMESRMMSMATKSDLAERITSGACYTPEDFAEDHPKELNGYTTERKQTKGLEFGDCAMQLETHKSSLYDEETQVSCMPRDSQMDHNLDANDVSFSATCGEWNAYWDSFYMRYYFYNTRTQESTWYTPPGMESLAYGDISDVFNDANAEVFGINVDVTKSDNVDVTKSDNDDVHLDRHDMVKKTCSNGQTANIVWGAHELFRKDSSSGSAMICDISCVIDGNCEYENANNNFHSNGTTRLSHSSSPSSIVEEACNDDAINLMHMDEKDAVTNGVYLQDAATATKQKKKKKNRRKKKFKNNENHELPSVEEFVDISKYWCQRYLLFSKFDDGVQMDEEGWFSVTPEAIAIHHASRLGGGIVIDCFAGVGGNVIQFAKSSKHVIAIDIDPKKIDYARHNAAIYGVEDKIDFINGDCFSLAPQLKADTIFLSPPWGGPTYLNMKSYDISMLQPCHGHFLFNTFMATASSIIMFLPRNVNIVQLAELTLSAKTSWSLEVEKNFLNGKLKAVTAYFSKANVC